MSGTATNAALTPNTDRLKVGDQTATQPSVAAAAPRAERKAFGSYLPLELQRQFKAACALRGLDIQDALEEAIRAWLEEEAS